MSKSRLLIFTLITLFCFSLFSPFLIIADDEDTKLRDLENQIAEYKEKIAQAKGTAQTLQSTINVLNNKIYLAQAEIQATTQQISALEVEIKSLSTKISELDILLDEVAHILEKRIEETYKRSYLPYFQLIISASNFSDFLSQFQYVKIAQKNDKENMFKMEEIKLDFSAKKESKEKKQTELEALQVSLAAQKQALDWQKAAKNDLLVQTKNDEKTFQSLLSQAQSEYKAIQTLLAGKGEMTKVKEVKAGDIIASLETGDPSDLCNSNGSHLHFWVSNKNSSGSYNPFEYLKNGIEYENCSGGGYGVCIASDPFNPSGSWEWPIAGPIRMTQGYGHTWSVQNITWLPYRFHNGIDITGSSITVRSVQDGVLYRGSFPGTTRRGNSCRLKYVFLEHSAGDRGTYYLHVNY